MKGMLLKSKVLKKSFFRKIFKKDLDVFWKPFTFAPASMKASLLGREVLKRRFEKNIQNDLEVIEKRLTFAPASMKAILLGRESS